MANEKALEAVGTTLTIGALTVCKVSIGSIGFDGGDAIDNTCLTNTAYVTKQPQALVEVPDFTFTCDYHPGDLAATKTEINKNQLLTLTFGTVGHIDFWGFLKAMEPKEAARGEAWRATGTIVVTNLKGSAVETAPTWT